jgi:lipase chaperone LimK
LDAVDREDAQWQSRFDGFWQARNYVMQAGLDDAERERQIQQLLNQYFSPDERERARETSFDWQARAVK